MLKFVKVFVATLFLSLNFGATLYVNSSYLGKFFGTDAVSFLFLLGAIGNVLLFLIAPKLLNLLGKKRLLFLTLLLLLSSTVGLWQDGSAWIIEISFLVYSSILFIVYYCLDIFIEEESEDAHTGEIRGIYFTVMNAGIALGPLLLSLLKVGDDLRQVYRAGSALLLIPLLIAFYILVTRKHAHKVKGHADRTLPLRRWWQNRNIRAATLAKLVLEIFFAVMVIYTPLYLHDVIGFAWRELGIIFAVALVPFVIFEWPAGELADRFWGEKEMMSVGFFITGTALLVIPFLGKVFLAWLIVLFLSRVGASLVEIMTETYFFKKIEAADTGLLSIFRLARPAGIILGSVLGAVSFGFFSFEKLFFVLALVVFFGMKESLYLKDTL